MKKLLVSIAFALSLSPAFAGGPEWQPFFTCDTTGTGGTCSYTLSLSVVMPTGSYTTNTLLISDGVQLGEAFTSQWTTSTSTVTLKDGSGNSMCSSPFTGSGTSFTLNSVANTYYLFTITCGSTGLTGGNTYTLTITGTANHSNGNTGTKGPYLFVKWFLS